MNVQGSCVEKLRRCEKHSMELHQNLCHCYTHPCRKSISPCTMNNIIWLLKLSINQDNQTTKAKSALVPSLTKQNSALECVNDIESF